MVKQKVYPDPDFGMNLRSYPGVTYPSARISRTSPCRPTVHSPCRGGIARSLQFRRVQGENDLAEFRRDQLSRQHLAERKTDCEVRGRRRARGGPTNSISPMPQSPARTMCWRCRYSLPPKTIWRSRLWIGIRRLRTRTWDCGAAWRSRPAARSAFVIPRLFRRSIRPENNART